MFDPVIDGVIEQTKGALLQTNPQLAKDLNEVAAQLRTEFAPRRRGVARPRSRAAYAQRFTEQELKDMLAFYKTPLGKKMIDAGAASARRDVQLSAQQCGSTSMPKR